MTVLRLRHKPTVVDAVRWDGTPQALDDLAALGFELGLHGRLLPADGDEPRVLSVFTHHGDVAALPGQSVIIRGHAGEWYPVAHDVAAAVYEAIPDGHPVAQLANGGPPELFQAVELPDGSTLNVLAWDDRRVTLNVVGGDRFVSGHLRTDADVTVYLAPRPGGGQS